MNFFTNHTRQLSYVLLVLCFFALLGKDVKQVYANSFEWPSVQVIVNHSVDRNTALARSGSVQWTISNAEKYLKRYRAWLHWETSSPQPLSTLNDISALRRILISALEREVLVRFAKENKNLSDSSSLERSKLKSWLLEMVPGSIRPSDKGLADFIRGRLKMKGGSDLAFFWEAAEDAYWVQKLKALLVSELKEEDAKAEWKRQGTLLGVWLLQIPRVPTSNEITKAVRRYPAEIKKYYQSNLQLFSQPLRLLVDPYWIKGGKLESHRLEAVEVQTKLSQGKVLATLREEHPQLSKGGSKTLRGRSIPKNTDIKEGTYTPIRLTRYGWTFYHIKRVYPEYVRSLKERSVEREVAAAVLREMDDLPRARKLAERAQKLLLEGKSLQQIKTWARANRVRISSPDPFFSSKQQVVPTVGLAPELHQRIFTLNLNEVSEPIKVRQHYVVAQLKEKKIQEDQWETIKKDFLKQWTIQRAPELLDEWLTKHLKDQPRWVRTKLLQYFRPENLRFESLLEPKSQQQ